MLHLTVTMTEVYVYITIYCIYEFVAREEEVVARLVALVRRGKAYLIHFISCGDCVGSFTLPVADGGPERYTL